MVFWRKRTEKIGERGCGKDWAGWAGRAAGGSWLLVFSVHGAVSPSAAMVPPSRVWRIPMLLPDGHDGKSDLGSNPAPATHCTARTGHTSPRTEASVSLVGHQRRWACGSPRQCAFWVQALGLWSASAWVKIPVMFPLSPMTLSKASRSKLGNAHSPHLLLLRGL